MSHGHEDGLRKSLNILHGSRIFDLEHTRKCGDPALAFHQPAFSYALRRWHGPDSGEPRTSASGIIVAADHSGTHIDALCHQAENLQIHGGFELTPDVQGPAGFTIGGAEEIEPIISRGVLLDVASLHGGILEEHYMVRREDLLNCEAREGIAVCPGDTVLIRTGYGSQWARPSRYANAAGISAEASLWLAGNDVHTVGIDNLSWDVFGSPDESTGSTLPGHVILLARHGIYILENLLLEELAQANGYEFIFIGLPLKVKGATGAPVRPVAILPQPDMTLG